MQAVDMATGSIRREDTDTAAGIISCSPGSQSYLNFIMFAYQTADFYNVYSFTNHFEFYCSSDTKLRRATFFRRLEKISLF